MTGNGETAIHGEDTDRCCPPDLSTESVHLAVILVLLIKEKCNGMNHETGWDPRKDVPSPWAWVSTPPTWSGPHDEVKNGDHLPRRAGSRHRPQRRLNSAYRVMVKGGRSLWHSIRAQNDFRMLSCQPQLSSDMIILFWLIDSFWPTKCSSAK